MGAARLHLSRCRALVASIKAERVFFLARGSSVVPIISFLSSQKACRTSAGKEKGPRLEPSCLAAGHAGASLLSGFRTSVLLISSSSCAPFFLHSI
jgi:hypothetical protein